MIPKKYPSKDRNGNSVHLGDQVIDLSVHCSFYGLLLFLSDTKSKKMYMDIFKELSSKAFTDASLMLLHLKNDEKNVHNIIHNLQLTADMNLNNAILQEICSHYGYKYEELEEGKGRKTFFWD
jgi:hypothetical protein